MLKYNRREAINAKALTPDTHAWFYVNEGSITVCCGTGCDQVKITRKQLLAALAGMRKRSR